MTRPEAERLAVLEVQMASMSDDVSEIRSDLKDLLALRHKGVGAFWLASALTGTGIIGGLSLLWDWLSR